MRAVHGYLIRRQGLARFDSIGLCLCIGLLLPLQAVANDCASAEMFGFECIYDEIETSTALTETGEGSMFAPAEPDVDPYGEAAVGLGLVTDTDFGDAKLFVIALPVQGVLRAFNYASVMLWETEAVVSERHRGAWRALDRSPDMDGDGNPDVWVSGRTAEGTDVWIFSGATGALIDTIDLAEDESLDCTDLRQVGDMDGDGRRDMVLRCAPQGSDEADDPGVGGRLYIHSTPADGPTTIIDTIRSSDIGDGNVRIDRGFDDSGDIDGDGFNEIAVAIRDFSTGYGSVQVRAGLDLSLHGQVLSVEPGRWFGDVRQTGDMDQDGYPDIVCGAPRRASTDDGQNRARIISPRRATPFNDAPGLITAELCRYEAGEEINDFGVSIGRVQDVDGDGEPDIAIGAPADATNGADAGRIDIMSNRCLLRYRNLGTHPGARLGQMVGGAGDVSGDDNEDIFATRFAYEGSLERVILYWWESGAPFMTVTANSLSVSAGIDITFDIYAGPNHYMDVFYVVGSLSGTYPGLAAAPWLPYMPLNLDAFMLSTLASVVDLGLAGTIDFDGHGQVSLLIPPSEDPEMAGLTIYLAAPMYSFDILTGAAFKFDTFSMPTAMTFEP